jgi:hypothetical protein
MHMCSPNITKMFKLVHNFQVIDFFSCCVFLLLEKMLLFNISFLLLLLLSFLALLNRSFKPFRLCAFSVYVFIPYSHRERNMYIVLNGLEMLLRNNFIIRFASFFCGGYEK